MIKLEICEIEGYHYILKSQEDQRYEFNIEFYDLVEKPRQGDFLFMNEEFVKEKDSVLSFGSIDSEYGREIVSDDDSDLLILVMHDERFYLKRLYG